VNIVSFLRYIVEETVAGRGGNIRESTLGVHVFDRGEDFNPRLDPIVRVQARNLRVRLAKYYGGTGAEDIVRIALPKGTYVPNFDGVTPAPEADTLLPPSPQAVALAAISVAPAAISVMPAPPPRSPVAQPQVTPPRYLVAALILLVILIGIAALWISHPRGAGAAMGPGALAEQLYQRGRFALDRETEASLRESIVWFEQALGKAPNYAAAHAGLSEAHNLLAQFGYVSPREGMEKARAEARRAIDLDPRLAEGHVALAAVVEAYDWDWPAAEREYRKALELSPALAGAHLWYGMFLRDQGRVDEAIPELRRAAELQPYSVIISVNLAYGLLARGDAAGALEAARKAVSMAPDLPTAALVLSHASHAMAHPADRAAALEKARRGARGNPHALSLVACELARAGRREESQALAGELNDLARERYVSPFDLGKVSLMLGDEDRAFGLFEEAFRERSTGLIFLRLSRGRVRNLARFDSLIGRMHFQG
jgi:serine/threonine-protein kinase